MTMSLYEAVGVSVLAGIGFMAAGRILRRRIAPLHLGFVGAGVIMLGFAAVGTGIDLMVRMVRSWPA